MNNAKINQKMILNTIKTLSFAGIIGMMILPFGMMDVADAKENYTTKTDEYLFVKADNIEKKYQDRFKYDKDGKNKSGETADHKGHEDIVKELNSRGIFHDSQDQQLMMQQINVGNSSIHGLTDFSIDVFLSPTASTEISTDNSVCCGASHNKRLSIKSGMEWNNPTFSWWEYRVESTWSSFTPTSVAITVSVGGDEYNVRPYVTVKADHAVTHADFQVGSEIKIMDQNNSLVSLGLNTGTYSDIYFATLITENTGMFSPVSYLSGGSTHTTEIQITSIS